MSPEHFARMRGLQAAYTSSNSRLLTILTLPASWMAS